MIVTCPECETRYRVDDDALGGSAGRRVRCASCGHVWHYSAEAAAIHAAVAEAAAAVEAAATSAPAQPGTLAPPIGDAARPEPRLDGESRAAAPSAVGTAGLSRPSIAVELPAARRQRSARAAWLAASVIVILLLLLVVAGRNTIMAIWPATTPLYEKARLTEAPGTGLEVNDLKPTRTPDSLVIDGDIVNRSQATRSIPKLRVTLRDGNQTDLDSKVIDPPVGQLAPGATAHFNTVFRNPSITATGVAVDFAAE